MKRDISPYESFYIQESGYKIQFQFSNANFQLKKKVILGILNVNYGHTLCELHTNWQLHTSIVRYFTYLMKINKNCSRSADYSLP